MPLLDPQKPYNDLPDLPPKTEIETREILKQCIKSTAALATLKQAGYLIPNQNVLINSIPLREAKDSSEIENIVTTGDNLFRYAALGDANSDDATKETLRYRTALFEGYKEIGERPVSVGLAVRICQIMRNVEIDVRNTLGTALRSTKTGEIIYTPPEGEALLRDKLGNWEKFLNEAQEIDPLIRLAIGHYQFEAIHPFTDGNGRTGRALNILYLIEQNYLDIPVLYLSRYIIEHKDDYYRLLQDVTMGGNWTDWITYMLIAIEITAKWTTSKILAIKALMDHSKDYVSAVNPRLYSHELIEIIFTQPYCKIDHLVDANIAKRATASKYLKELCQIDVLNEAKFGREKVFIHPTFTDLLMSDENDFDLYGPTISAKPGPL